MKIKNKKAQVGSGILWLYKFIMLIIVIGGIVAVVFLHYSKQYDVREIELNLLAGNMLECFSDKGKIEHEDFTNEKLYSCLNFDEKEIFLNVTLEEEGKQNSISLGDKHLEVYCELGQEKIEGKKLPSCLRESYDVLIDETPGKIEFFIALLKSTKNT